MPQRREPQGAKKGKTGVGGRFASNPRANDHKPAMLPAPYAIEEDELDVWPYGMKMFTATKEWVGWLNANPEVLEAYQVALRSNYYSSMLEEFLDAYGVREGTHMTEPEAKTKLMDEYELSKAENCPIDMENILHMMAEKCGNNATVLPNGAISNFYEKWKQAAEEERLFDDSPDYFTPPPVSSEKLLNDFLAQHDGDILAGYVMFHQGQGWRDRNPELVKAAQNYAAASANDMITTNNKAITTVIDAIEQEENIVEILGASHVKALMKGYEKANQAGYARYTASVNVQIAEALQNKLG